MQSLIAHSFARLRPPHTHTHMHTLQERAHCDKSQNRDECINMTLSETTFDLDGMTHVTRALPSTVKTMCVRRGSEGGAASSKARLTSS